MALQKQSLPINFREGLDQKSDPHQVKPGKFVALQNTVFTKEGLLQKRNGYAQLPSLPAPSSIVTTFNGNLTGIGPNLYAYSQGQNTYITKGAYKPLSLNTLPLIRTNTNQLQCDTAIAPNGLICTVFTDNNGSSSSYKYAIADSVTGQNIIAPTLIPVSSGTVTGSPRVFVLGNYFIILFTNVITATNHLQYVAINIANPSSVTTNADISAQYTPATTVAFDAAVSGNALYIAWNGSDGGGAIRVTYLTQALVVATPAVFTSRVATQMSVAVDSTGLSGAVIYAGFYDSGSSTGYVLAVDPQLNTILSPTQFVSATTVLNVAIVAQNKLCSIFFEVSNNYSFDASIPTHFVRYRTITQAGTLNTAATIDRSVGLASKAFIIDGAVYILVAYSSAYQPTYFLIDSTGAISAKLAYSNGGGYLATGLPSVNIVDGVAKISYLIKDFVSGVNKAQGTPAAAVSAVYTQKGVNLVSFVFGTTQLDTSEIGGNLNISGGFLWGYDGYSLVESGFFVWPDLQLNADGTYHGLSTSTTGGSITDQQYFYQVIYEWSDNQGNIFRSAPSIPVTITTAGGNTSTNTLIVPTLRLTYKTSNPVKVVIFRASVAQATYYQVTSISAPLLNTTSADTVTFVDTLADSAIIGNSIIYTAGGVIENIAPPATDVMALYRSRLFLLDSEDRNLLWYSKQVIEATPVEMSDLFTIYIGPTTGSQGSTGDTTALSAMDDKLIIFKKSAIYYIIGTGPDNTGANNDFSEPVFITSTVGCDNQASIVLGPNGLIFQSTEKGIWILGRDLSTNYVGAAVENNGRTPITSAVSVPGANEIRLTLSSGITLLYDYYYAQWGTFNISAVSSTVYQGLHTFIDQYGRVFQESPGSYLDGAEPVLMSLTTGWIHVAGVQGFQRAYAMYMLATYYSPHVATFQIGYDYNPPSQQIVINPDNFNGPYGSDALYGDGSVYGGNPAREQWELNFSQQKCEAFQISMQESYDASLGAVAGAGLSISEFNIEIGIKGPAPKIRASNSA